MNNTKDITHRIILDLQSIIAELANIQSLQDFMDKKSEVEKLHKLQDFVLQLNHYAPDFFQPQQHETWHQPISPSSHHHSEYAAHSATTEVEVSPHQSSELLSEQAQWSENKKEDVHFYEHEKKGSEENEPERGQAPSTDERMIDIQENELLGDFDNGEESVCLGGVEPRISDKMEEIEPREVEQKERAMSDESTPTDDKKQDVSHQNQETPAHSAAITEVSPPLDPPSPGSDEKKLPSHEPDTSVQMPHAKKMRLANIKGIHTPLFEEGQKEVQGEFFADMFPKSPKHFKLDLNDKLAFSQKLFDGSQHELNETVKVLNSFDNIEAAKEYLSDMYYEKNWQKVDEYAQRLWSLVENRFL